MAPRDPNDRIYVAAPTWIPERPTLSGPNATVATSKSPIVSPAALTSEAQAQLAPKCPWSSEKLRIDERAVPRSRVLLEWSP